MKEKVIRFSDDFLSTRRPSVAEDSETRSVAFKKTSAYDENGELIYESMRKPKCANGSGWVISYTEKMCEFLQKCTTGSIVRVFMYIAHHQNYGTDGRTYGYRVSHKYLCTALNINNATLWDALKYLRDNFLCLESRVDGLSEFMVNPNYVTIGTDKKARMREWSRRWEEYWKRVNQSK